MSSDMFIGSILVEKGILSEERLEEISAIHREKGGSLMEHLLACRAVEEEFLLKSIAEELDLEFVEKIDSEGISPELIENIPITFAKQYKLIPLRIDDDRAVIATAAPLDIHAQDDVRGLLGTDITICISPAEEILSAINSVYERQTGEDELESGTGEFEDEPVDLIDIADEAPIIRWVNSLFFQAVKERASDIHIEPGEREVYVRYRIDGVLYETKKANKGNLASIISRVKIMAGLNIAEKRLPQDGRISLKIAGKSIDVRVSTIPTSQGERVVMRLLDKTTVLLDLSDLGFASDHHEIIGRMITRPHGIILVTGPTGSGKTTTLYACLSKINRPDINILTVEEPVEYDISGISQMQVNPKINLTFASGLRHFLRQDPDVIMVGEIRDRETAEIAIHASLTGHLVLSTIHTNDSSGAVTRLVEMDIEPFLVASSLMSVLAQRLVRVLCPHCREIFQPVHEQLEELGLTKEQRARRFKRDRDEGYRTKNTEDHLWDPSFDPVFYQAVGCEKCQHTGYLGRTAIYELLMINDDIRTHILRNSDSNTVKRSAVESGMVSLREDGARKVLMGHTTVEEVLRVTQEDVI